MAKAVSLLKWHCAYPKHLADPLKAGWLCRVTTTFGKCDKVSTSVKLRNWNWVKESCVSAEQATIAELQAELAQARARQELLEREVTWLRHTTAGLQADERRYRELVESTNG